MLRILVTTALLALTVTAARAENLPMDHPSVEVVKNYLGFVTEQNWKEAAKLVKPSAIEKKRVEAIATLKNAPTMSDEENVLAKFGVKDIKALESMPLVDFFAADRAIFHSRGRTLSPDQLKKKRESLKINVLGVVGEADRQAAHLVVRTYQEAEEYGFDELIFITAVNQDGKWVVAPDNMHPVVKSLKGGAAPAAAAPGSASPQ
jgi:hypothetical protein